jgi:hypothetical protein
VLWRQGLTGAVKPRDWVRSVSPAREKIVDWEPPDAPVLRRLALMPCGMPPSSPLKGGARCRTWLVLQGLDLGSKRPFIARVCLP